jgi:hypothetical protein
MDGDPIMISFEAFGGIVWEVWKSLVTTRDGVGGVGLGLTFLVTRHTKPSSVAISRTPSNKSLPESIADTRNQRLATQPAVTQAKCRHPRSDTTFRRVGQAVYAENEVALTSNPNWRTTPGS